MSRRNPFNVFRTKEERTVHRFTFQPEAEELTDEVRLWTPPHKPSHSVAHAPPYTDGFGRVLPLVTRKLNDVWAKRVEEKQSMRDEGGTSIASIMYYGGIMATAFNLASTTIGTGLLSIPAAMHATGIYLGVVYLVIIGLLTIYSYTLLGAVGMRTGLRSYEKNMSMLFGRGGSIFATFVLVLYCFGAAMSFIVAVSNVMEVLFVNANENLAYLQSTSGRRLLTSMVWMSCMLPMCLPRHRNSLRFFSFIAVSLMMVFTAFIVIHAVQHGFSDGLRKDLVFMGHGNAAIKGMASNVFAYLSSVNAYGVFAELHHPSVRRLAQSSALCVAMAFTMYLLVGLFGYFEFGPLVASVSALELYHPAEDLMMGVGYFFVVFKVCVSYGLHVMPVRDGLYFLAGTSVEAMSLHGNWICVIIVAVLTLVIAFAVPDIGIFVDIVGGCLGGFVAFIFPALMVMYTGDFTPRSVGIYHYMGAFFVLAAGVIATAFGSCSAVYNNIVVPLLQ